MRSRSNTQELPCFGAFGTVKLHTSPFGGMQPAPKEGYRHHGSAAILLVLSQIFGD